MLLCYIGNMVLMGTTDCVYCKFIEELYKLDYQKDLWYFNAGELPQYAILDQYPGIAATADEGVHQGKPHAQWRVGSTIPVGYG